tara:strand:- start:353 stop:811 length:459 start_codon:yes stop_codon:yes gene_type:complete
MRRLMERWNNYLREDEDMDRVSKAILVGDVEEFNDGKILILKRAANLISDASPWEWDLPGGHVQEGEADRDALAREIREETGFDPLHIPNWFLLDNSTRFFIIQDWGGSFQLSDEHSDYEWIYPSEVTNYNIGKMYTNAINQAFKGSNYENH